MLFRSSTSLAIVALVAAPAFVPAGPDCPVVEGPIVAALAGGLGELGGSASDSRLPIALVAIGDTLGSRSSLFDLLIAPPALLLPSGELRSEDVLVTLCFRPTPSADRPPGFKESLLPPINGLAPALLAFDWTDGVRDIAAELTFTVDARLTTGLGLEPVGGGL